MSSAEDPANIPVDNSAIDPMRRHYGLALNRWAYKNHISARRKLEGRLFSQKGEPLSIRTIDDIIQGKLVISTDNAMRLPDILGFAFTQELFDVLIEAGEDAALKRIVHRFLTDLNREFHHDGERRAVACDYPSHDLRGRPFPPCAES